MAKQTRQIKRLLCILSMALLVFAPMAKAESSWSTFIPPELAYSDDLRQKITIPNTVNINHGSLNQLMVLPGFDEEVALKIMRSRPFEDVRDFYKKMPGMSKKNIDQLIEHVQPKLLFN